MKTYGFISIFIIFFITPVFSQTSWTGGGTTNSFSDMANWSQGVPVAGSTVIFDTGGNITVTNIPSSFTSSMSINMMIISSNTNVTFDSENNASVNFYVDTLSIDAGSSLILRGNNPLNYFTQTSNIYGTLDAGDKHIFNTFGTGNGINFFDYSKFITANHSGFRGSITGSYLIAGIFGVTYNGTVDQITGFDVSQNDISVISVENPGVVSMNTDISLDTLNIIDGVFEIANNRLSVFGMIQYTAGFLRGGSGVLKFLYPSSGTVPVTVPISLDSLIIDADINLNVVLEGGDIADINNLALYNGQLSIQDCELDINNSFDRWVSSAFLSGNSQSRLRFNNLSAAPSSLNTITLGKFFNSSPFRIFLDGDMTIESLLDLQGGILDINGYTLTLNGDYSYSGGLIAGSGTSSSFVINDINSTQNITDIMFDSVDKTFSVFTVNKTGGIVNLKSQVDIFGVLNIYGGRLRIENDINVSGAINANTNDNYIITVPGAYVNTTVAAGTSYHIPVGTESYIAPVDFSVLTAGTYSIGVRDTLFSEGNFGPALESRNVKLRWEIYPDADFDVILSWNPSAEAVNFDLTQSYISNFNGYEWDNVALTAGTNSNGLNSQSRSFTAASGYFGVFSSVNNLPVAAYDTVFTSVDLPYVFIPEDFRYYDADGDYFSKVEITSLPLKGNLFRDFDGDNIVSASESVAAGDQIYFEELIAGYLKFIPFPGETGFPYTDFSFRVSDGISYSANDYLMTINVSDNHFPVASNQTFTVPEHSPAGTFVGQIIASDPDSDLLSFYVTGDIPPSEAFVITGTGEIIVNNPDLLEFSVNPSFTYSVDVCDNGSPVLCVPIEVTVNLEEVITDLLPANFISPNGDGINDTWVVRGLENGTFEAFIFNGNGQLLFHSSDYRNEWDGTNGGRELPQGVYYYLLRSDNIELKGTVTLER